MTGRPKPNHLPFSAQNPAGNIIAPIGKHEDGYFDEHGVGMESVYLPQSPRTVIEEDAEIKTLKDEVSHLKKELQTQDTKLENI